MLNFKLSIALAALIGLNVGTSHADTLGTCTEGFDSVTSALDRGWIARYRSLSLGTTGWFQGLPARFNAHQGATNSYISADRNNASGGFAVVSTWLISPEIAFAPGMSYTFYTRSQAGTPPDRMLVRLCVETSGTNCIEPGPDSGSFGDFSSDLLAININQTDNGYPTGWAFYQITSAQGLPTSGRGRIAFHYHNPATAENQYGTTIGIDTVEQSGGTVCSLNDGIFRDGLDR